MYFKYFKTNFLLFLFCGISLCSSEKSFTVVLDTTLSMQDEIDVIRRNVGVERNKIQLQDAGKYILVPFKDPEVGPPLIFPSLSGLFGYLMNNLTISGGQDCPENSLAGIKQALEVSSPESYIFVFTDAYANDNSKLDEVKHLCRNTKSQVIIFLSGSCVSANGREGNIDVYLEVARSCRGSIFQFDPANLRQAFVVIKEVMNTDWNKVETFDNIQDITFVGDDSISDMMIAVHGNDSRIRLFNSNEHLTKLERIISTPNEQVYRLENPYSGNYSVTINSNKHTWATVYRRTDIPMKIGFSIRRPQSIKETSIRPLPGFENFILIVLSSDSTIELQSAELLNVETNKRSVLTLEEDSERKAHYISNDFFRDDTFFQITVFGQDKANYKDIKKTTKVLETQKLFGIGVKEVPETKPQVEIVQPINTLIDFGSNLRVACVVIGYPQSVISWKNENGDTLPSEAVLVEVPDIFVSYADINWLRNNSTITCEAKNSEGEDSQSLAIFVENNFVLEVKQVPRDQTIEYGTEARLHCEVESNPEATIQWYHNNTLLNDFFSQDYEFTSQRQTLLIKQLSLEYTGEYKCEVTNGYETKNFTATINVTGLEAPHIELDKSEVIVKPGDWIEIECDVSGKPTPEITFKHKCDDAMEFSELPDDVYFENSKLKLPSVKLEHSGVYRCEATNALGQDHRDVTIKIQYAPILKTKQETLIVREGDMVELDCEVDALPSAEIHWEMGDDGVIVAFDSRHTTDEYHHHRFEALWKDSGKYRCIAENVIGKAEKIITVNVLVAPYIQPPQHKTITTKVGSSISLACNILFGNPLPSTRWEFISVDSVRTLLFRGNTTQNDLLLSNLSKYNEGLYICITDNEIGSDNIKITLNIQ